MADRYLTDNPVGSNDRQIDRAALIDAVAREYVGDDEELLKHSRPLVAATLDKALPLIADLLGDRVGRAERHRSFGPMGAKDYWLGFTEGTSEARDLVRSLRGDDGE